MKDRMHWLDITKGLGISLVVLGHLPLSEGVRAYILSFHMPLFFFLSGCLFKPNKYGSFRDFFKKRLTGLLIPYFWFYIYGYIYWILTERNYGSVTGGSLIKPVVGFFYARNVCIWQVRNPASGNI